MLSEDRQLLFVGGYATADKAGVQAFEFESLTGSLNFKYSFSGIANPSFLAVHPNQRWLYAVSETGLDSDGRTGVVYALRFRRDPMVIEPINQRFTKGDYPCHLAIDGSGQWLLVSNYGSGSFTVYPIRADGELGEIQLLIEHQGQGPNRTRQEKAHVHSTTITPDNRYVIVADLGIDQLVIYQFDESNGQLSPHAITRTRPGAGPRHCAFHPLGRWLYLANELDNTVTFYSYDAEQGELQEQQTLDTLPPGAPENTVADIHVSPSGKRVYVSNRGHNSIAVFEVDDNGRLTNLGFPSCGGDWPRNFSLAPDGRFLLVANRRSDKVSVLPVGLGEDELSEPVSQVVVNQPSSVQFVSG